MLPRDEFNRRSFVDENALMVGLVRREFRDSQSISDYAEELADFGVDQWVWLNMLAPTFCLPLSCSKRLSFPPISLKPLVFLVPNFLLFLLSKVPNPLTENFPFPISHPKLLSPPSHSDILAFSPHTHTRTERVSWCGWKLPSLELDWRCTPRTTRQSYLPSRGLRRHL